MIPIVRRHPHGGFAVVQMEHEADGAPAVIPGHHDRFSTYHDACVAAEAEETGASFLVHREIP